MAREDNGKLAFRLYDTNGRKKKMDVSIARYSRCLNESIQMGKIRETPEGNSSNNNEAEEEVK